MQIKVHRMIKQAGEITNAFKGDAQDASIEGPWVTVLRK